MICKVRNTVEKYRMLDNVRSVAVGVSGGADSMCLVNVLSTLKEEYGIILKVVHINHNLRGEEALRDEMKVRDFCEKNGIECIVFSKDIRQLAKEKGLSEEECGRLVRYECFSKAGCDAVAVAHSLSDSIETFVFNMLRGTGSKGLCGIPAKREPNIIRPLIECTRQEIERYCIENSIDFVTDSTNLTDDYTRNFIRHNIVSDFASVNQGYEKNFAGMMSILSEENDFIEQSAIALMKESENEKGYDRGMIIRAHAAVRKRVICRILNEYMDKSISAKNVELVDSTVVCGKGKVQIAQGLYVCVDSDIINVCREKVQQEVLNVPFVNNEAQNALGRFVTEEFCGKMTCCPLNCYDADKINGELVLSGRMPSDSFTFKKRRVTKSLKKLFNEMKIPAQERNSIAIVRDDKNIVWVEGVGVNAPYVPDKGTRKICVIKKEG